MAPHDFDLTALYAALDARRRERGLSWAGVRREISGAPRAGVRSIAASTIAGLRDRRMAEGDGVLAMLCWLDRSPESFVVDDPAAADPRLRLPRPARGVIRFDTRLLAEALERQRRQLGMTKRELVRLLRISSTTIAALAAGGRTAFPPVMRMIRWLDRPAVDFIRVAKR